MGNFWSKQLYDLEYIAESNMLRFTESKHTSSIDVNQLHYWYIVTTGQPVLGYYIVSLHLWLIVGNTSHSSCRSNFHFTTLNQANSFSTKIREVMEKIPLAKYHTAQNTTPSNEKEPQCQLFWGVGNDVCQRKDWSCIAPPPPKFLSQSDIHMHANT